jgi:hypothetical protein
MPLPRFSGVLLLVILAGTLFLLSRAQVAGNIRDATDLSASLKENIVPDIVADGETYTIDAGSVIHEGVVVPSVEALPILRTAYFSIAHRLDPILALEGTDPAKLADALVALEGSVRTFSSAYDEKTQKLLAKSFYPIRFLQTLPALEEKRRAVLSHPTPHNADTYGEALLASLTRYRAALKESEASFAALGEASADTIYTFPGGITTLETMRTGLAALDSGAAAAYTKAKARLACLRGQMRCEPIEAPMSKSADADAASSALLPPLPERVRSLLGAAERARSQALEETFDERGVVVLSESICLPDFSPLYAYLWRTSDGSNMPVFRFQPLNDLYFYDVREKTRSVFYTRMREAGMDFLAQGISNLYECPDSGRESARIASAHALATAIADRPLFPPSVASSDPALEKIAAEEKRISGGSLILESAIARYVADLSALLREKGERALAEETSPETVFEAERRITLFHNRSALFDEQIGSVISMNNILDGMGAIAGNVIPLFPLYMSRSYPSLVYLAGNESIVPSPVSFFTERSTQPLSKFQIVPYTTLQKTYSDADILRFLNLSNQAYATMGR